MSKLARTCFIAGALLLGALVSLPLGAAQNPLSGESGSSRSAKSQISGTSLVDLAQHLLQDYQRLHALRAEHQSIEAEVGQAQSDVEELTGRVRATPATTKSGEENPKREPLERRLAAAQARINSGNQKLSRLDDAIDDLTSSRNATALALVRRIVIFLVLALIIWALARLMKRLPERLVKEEQDRFYIHKIITYSGRLVVIILFLYTVFGELGSFSAFLGLTGAGIAIALQDVIVSFVAWFFIIGRRGLAIGNRIEVSGVRGDVVDIGVLRTVVQEVGNWLSNDVPTGRRVFIPNSFIFKNYFFNYTKPQPFINDEIKLLFTYESDWEKAVALVQTTAKEVLDRFFGGEGKPHELLPQNESLTHWGVGLNAALPEVFTRIADSGVEIRLVYFSRVQERNLLRDALNRALLKAIQSHPGVSLAYPTSRAIPTPPGVKP